MGQLTATRIKKYKIYSQNYQLSPRAKVQTDFGPSGVRALPLAAGINEGGHYFRYFSS